MSRKVEESLLILTFKFVVHAQPHRLTTNHTDRGFGVQGTLPDDMGHDVTALSASDYETAAP